MDQPTQDDLQHYRASPVAFAQSLTIAGGNGPVRFGDVLADFQRDAFQAMAPSLLAVAAGTKPPSANLWIERTKGASKDSDLAVAILWVLTFANRPILVQVGASDLEQAGEVVKAVREVLRLNGWLQALIEVQRFRILNARTDTVAEVLAADPASAHGSRPDITICNELSHMREQSFAETLMDNSAKMPNGLVIIATNAGFLGTWQARWREQAMHSPRWWFQKVDQPAPWISPEAIAEAQIRNSTSRFNRLWMGVWSTEGGDALNPGDIAAAITLPGPEDRADGASWYLAAVDRSLRRDNTAVVVVGVRPGAKLIRVVWVRSWRPTGANPELDEQEVERTIVEANGRFQPITVKFDPFAMDTIAYRCRRQGVPMSPCPFAGNNLDTMARAMMTAFKDRLIRLYNSPELLHDLGVLSIQENRAGFGLRLTASRDELGHADAGMALAEILPAAVQIAPLGRPGAAPPHRQLAVVATTSGNRLPLHADGSVNTVAAFQLQQRLRG